MALKTAKGWARSATAARSKGSLGAWTSTPPALPAEPEARRSARETEGKGAAAADAAIPQDSATANPVISPGCAGDRRGQGRRAQAA